VGVTDREKLKTLCFVQFQIAKINGYFGVRQVLCDFFHALEICEQARAIPQCPVRHKEKSITNMLLDGSANIFNFGVKP